MLRLSFRKIGVLIATLLWVHAVRADGFRNPPDTAAALGKAGKNIVWGDDPSVLFYNPANLVYVPSREVQISALAGYSHADYSGILGNSETERPWFLVPAFALAWPLKVKDEDLSFGFGVHVPYGRQTRWDSNGPLRYAAPAYTKMTVTDFTPAFAWRITDSLSVGAGLDMYYGQLQFRQLLLSPQGEGSVTADADGYAVGGNIGITWQMTSSQRLSLTYRSPFDLTFSGDLKTTNVPFPAVASSEVDTSFSFPTIVALGYGIQLTDTVRLEADVEWLQFSRYKTMVIDAGQNNALISMLGLSSTAQNWDDTWTFGLGPEWRFAPEWTLRAGYLYLQSPIPDSTFAPSALDVDQSLVSVGLGYKHGRHAVDIAYALGIFNERHIRYNQNPAYQNGSYEFQGHLAALTYTYAF